MTDSKFLVPLAIVLAGVFVAGAIYLSGERAERPAQEQTGAEVRAAINLSPVTERDFIRGERSAPVVLVEYSDINCPFCKSFHSTMKNVLNAYENRVAWVYRHLTVLGQNSVVKALATECAAEQGDNELFWQYIDRVFDATDSNNQLSPEALSRIAGELELDTETFDSCLNSDKYQEYVAESTEDGFRAGARGTPFSVFVVRNALSPAQTNALSELTARRGLNPETVVVSTDGMRVAIGGALPLDLMRNIIDVLLAN